MSSRHLFTGIIILLTGTWLSACAQGDRETETESDTTAATAEASVVRITAKDFEFEAPSRIPSGWTTIQLENAGEQEHFAYIYQIPDTISFAQYQQEMVQTFGDVWSRYDSGELTREETLQALGEELPEWFVTGVVPSGGAALTEPGETSQVTLALDPGNYVIECYVKTPQGTWHTERGMTKSLTVTTETTGAQPPEAGTEITLSNYQIQAPDAMSAGEHTIAVRVEENPEGFNMHDVNLIRLENGATVEEAVSWMDWMDLEQFRAPAPGYSLGGVDQMVAGRTAFMTVELTPGDYLWISEGYAGQGMVKEFTVTGEGADAAE